MKRNDFSVGASVVWIVASIAALALASVGVNLVYEGIEFMGTPLWGYEDNQLGVYLVVGGVYAGMGVVLLLPVCFLLRKAILSRRGGRSSQPGSQP